MRCIERQIDKYFDEDNSGPTDECLRNGSAKIESKHACFFYLLTKIT